MFHSVNRFLPSIIRKVRCICSIHLSFTVQCLPFIECRLSVPSFGCSSLRTSRVTISSYFLFEESECRGLTRQRRLSRPGSRQRSAISRGIGIHISIPGSPPRHGGRGIRRRTLDSRHPPWTSRQTRKGPYPSLSPSTPTIPTLLRMGPGVPHC